MSQLNHFPVLSLHSLTPFVTAGGFFYCTIWIARLSIIFTVVRFAPWTSQKRVMLVIAAVIFLQWILLMVQMFWVCEKGDTSWKEAPLVLCPLGLRVAITQVVSEHLSHRFFNYPRLNFFFFSFPSAETFSDILLIVAPLWIIRSFLVTSSARFRLISVFASSLLTTVAALAHAILVVRFPGVWEAIFAALEAGIALAVCNLFVLVPAVARLLGGDAEKYRETGDSDIPTIGGTGAPKNVHNLDDAMLGTSQVCPTVPLGAVRVSVTVEQDQADWGTKRDIEVGSGDDIYNLAWHKT